MLKAIYKGAYEKEIKRLTPEIEKRSPEELWPLIEQLLKEIAGIIWGDGDRPKWWNIIWKVGQIIGKIAAVIIAYRRANK